MITYILYNPHAGHGSSADDAKALASKYTGDVTLYDMTEITDYAALLSPLTASDRVIVCGGDGTLNRFVNDTEGVAIHCEILYFAMGTGNDFLHDLGLAPGADPVAVNKYIENLPVAELKGKKYRFFNNVGFGIDGYCCEVGDRLKASSDKPVNYTAIAIKGLLFHYKPKKATVVVDGKTYTYKKVWLATTMKGRYYGGGMMSAPMQDRLAEDGETTVVVFHGKGRIGTLLAFPKFSAGAHAKKKMSCLSLHKGKDITVSFDKPAAVQVDGETVLDVTSYHVLAGKDAPVFETV